MTELHTTDPRSLPLMSTTSTVANQYLAARQKVANAQAPGANVVATPTMQVSSAPLPLVSELPLPAFAPPKARQVAAEQLPLSALEEHWRQVGEVQAAVTRQLEENGIISSEIPLDSRREQGRTFVTTYVRQTHVPARQRQGDERWSEEQIRQFEKHVMDAMFGLGRLQDLVDREDVENVEITGCDQVLLQLAEGGFETAPPVAPNDQALRELIQTIATQRGTTERPFTEAHPFLALALPGGYRLQAADWVTPRIKVVIRRDRLRDIDLDGLIELGEIDTTIKDFLTAAVRAHKSIVVSGQGQGSGKTTLVRALANALDPWESLAVLETDRELRLDEYPERHKRVTSLEARPGSGEGNADSGEITVDTMIPESLRFNIDRVIVGEVRGPEIRAMLKAMQMGNGSLSTIHANSAGDVIERMATLVTETGATESFAYRQVGQNVDLVVFIAVDVDPVTKRKRRYVTEILEVSLKEGSPPVGTNQIFAPHPEHRRAVPRLTPSFIDDLVEQGFHPAVMGQSEGAWKPEALQ